MSNGTSVLNVRVSAEQRDLLAAAAEQADVSNNDFVLRKALDAAEADVLSKGPVTIPASDWESFETWAERPAEVIPTLRDLFASKPTLE